jgi:hypothetical protein
MSIGRGDMLISPTHSIAGDVDIHGNINKELKMERKDLSLETVMSLQQELEEALDNYWHFLDVGDYRLSDMWLKIVDEISKDIRSL